MPTIAIPELLDPEETAELLGVTTGTLSVWRCTRRYPLDYVRVGRSIKYPADSVRKFITSRTVSTSPVTSK